MRCGTQILPVLFFALAVSIAAPCLSETQEPADTSLDPIDVAKTLIQQGKYANAESEAQVLLERMRAEHGVESAEVAAVMDVLVEARWRGGKAQDPETRELAEQVIALKERVLNPNHLDVAESLTNLGVIGFFLGDFELARTAWERALTIRESELGSDDPAVAQLLNNLGNLATNIGDLGTARELHERALAIREKAFGAEHPTVAQSLNNLAIAMTESGAYAEALPYLERSLELKQKLLGPDHPKTAVSEVALARAHLETGRYDRAMPLFERATATIEKTLGPEHPQLALMLNNQAEGLREMRKFGEARPLYERALTIDEAAFGPEHPLVAGLLGNLGYLEEAAGDLKQAMLLHERAVAIREKVLDADDPQLALSLNNLASVRATVGNYEGARPLFERALEIRREALGSDHPLVAETLNGFALLTARTGDTGRALGYALEAERIARDHLRLTGRSLSEEAALRYAAVRHGGLDLALTLAVRGLDPSSSRSVFDALIRSRAVVLDGIAARSRKIVGADDPEIVRLMENLADARAKLANMTVRGLGKLDAATYRGLLKQARDERDRAERELAVASADFVREKERGRIGLDEVSASLPSGSALVAFAVYARQDLGSPAKEGAPSQAAPVPSYLGFVLTPDKKTSVVDLGSAEPLEQRVTLWKEEVSTGLMRAGRTPDGAEAAYREAGGRLRKSLWDPFHARLQGAGRVFIVPDGVLNLVSFASLPVGTTSYLIEDAPLVHYVSAERDLVPADSEIGTGVGLLVLGGPDYDAGGDTTTPGASATTRATRASCGGFENLKFDALPATAREATQVADLWRDTEQGGADAGQLLHLSGAGATEAAFKKHAPGRRVLHLATHGFFLGGDCASAAGMRGIGGLAPAGPEAPPLPAPTMSPLLLSGLALSGANQRRNAAADEEDGILTAEEIAGLDLSRVEWAVLSACDTGLGEIQAGEGVFGLRRAMSVAGVRSLIMSLWSVDDEATQEWMRALYDGRFRQGLDTTESTRAAGLHVLESRRRAGLDTLPFYWAAFVAVGDWR